jgi:hypothetical protein
MRKIIIALIAVVLVAGNLAQCGVIALLNKRDESCVSHAAFGPEIYRETKGVVSARGWMTADNYDSKPVGIVMRCFRSDHECTQITMPTWSDQLGFIEERIPITSWDEHSVVALSDSSCRREFWTLDLDRGETRFESVYKTPAERGSEDCSVTGTDTRRGKLGRLYEAQRK